MLIGVIYGAIAIFFGLYCLRNDAVFRFRMDVLFDRKTSDRYEDLPSYDTMFFRFWVWPVEKFLPPGCPMPRRLTRRQRRDYSGFLEVVTNPKFWREQTGPAKSEPVAPVVQTVQRPREVH
jgi:hypothetical protein